jgi:aminoglycoside phosphotransferase (APT) family kinase protein
MSAVAGPDRGTLAAWLSEIIPAPIVADDLVLATPSGGGWSNDTWLVSGLGSGRRVVLRVQPERRSMFPRYDLARQVACLDVLAAEPSVPTPAVLGRDLAGERLGRPSFVMEFVIGRTPSDDRPTFAESGWLADATPEQQREFHVGMIDAIVALHAVDPDQDLLRKQVEPTMPPLDELEEVWHFDQGSHRPAVLDDVFSHLRSSAPPLSQRCLLWGDARPANAVVGIDHFRPVALIDWELATIGSPEFDVQWMAEMNWMRMEGAALTRLPGFLTDDEVVDRYQIRSGRTLHDLEWYRQFAALRVAVLMHRYLRAMVHAERLPADHKLLSETVASRRVVSLMRA